MAVRIEPQFLPGLVVGLKPYANPKDDESKGNNFTRVLIAGYWVDGNSISRPKAATLKPGHDP